MRQLLMAFIVIVTFLLTLRMMEMWGIFLSLVFYCLLISVSYAFLLQPYENELTGIQRMYSTTSWNDLGLIGKGINLIFLSLLLLGVLAIALALLELVLRAIFDVSLLESLGIRLSH